MVCCIAVARNPVLSQPTVVSSIFRDRRTCVFRPTQRAAPTNGRTSIRAGRLLSASTSESRSTTNWKTAGTAPAGCGTAALMAFQCVFISMLGIFPDPRRFVRTNRRNSDTIIFENRSQSKVCFVRPFSCFIKALITLHSSSSVNSFSNHPRLRRSGSVPCQSASVC